MKRKTLFWAALLAVIALGAGAVWFLAPRSGTVAAVYVDGELYGTYDLAAAVIPYEVTVTTEKGYNTLRIAHGTICVAEADCPGQDCVRQGEIHDSLLPIVCLPHRIVIEIEE